MDSYLTVVAIGAAATGGFFWLAVRRPGWLLLAVLATFALGPQWIQGTPLPSPWMATYATPLHKLLLVAALVANAVHYQVRHRFLDWPVLAVVWLGVQTVLLADPAPGLSAAAMAIAAVGLALPWAVIHAGLEPDTRLRHALILAALPVISVAAGAILEVAGFHHLFSGSIGRGLRLHGANNAGWLAFLGFCGFAVGLHEAVRGRSFGFAALALVDLVITVLTGGRMGVVAALLLFGLYGWLSGAVRSRRGWLAGIGMLAGAAAATAVIWYLLPAQRYPELDRLLDSTGRGEIWARFFELFQRQPIFGAGLGASDQVVNYYHLPHNEYLRMLVDGGVVGLTLFVVAVLWWGRRVLGLLADDDRRLALALFAALALYTVTDNTLTMVPAPIPFIYLAVMLTDAANRRRLLVEARLPKNLRSPRKLAR